MRCDPGVLMALAARCEKASGPDRALDLDMYFALECVPYTGQRSKSLDMFKEHAGFGNVKWLMKGDLTPTDGTLSPAYTASIDAATALLERVLPGWDWQLERLVSSSGPYALAEVGDRPQVEAATPALALVSAALRALAALPNPSEDLTDG